MTLCDFMIRVGQGLVDKSDHSFEETPLPIETQKQARFVGIGHYPQKIPPIEKKPTPLGDV